MTQLTEIVEIQITRQTFKELQPTLAGGFKNLGQVIRSLFAANEPGVWYDPSDLSTLFQDSAGTTPVTAVEQPVGLMLDKSGNCNHATQPTATSRPVLSARVNLLTNTVFSGAVAGTPGVAPTGWSFNSIGGKIVSANGGVITFSATNARQIIGVIVTLPANVTQTWSVRIEANPNKLPFNQLFFAVDATAAVPQYKANGINVDVTSYVPDAGDTLSITLINGATQITPIFRIGVGTSSAVTGTAAFSRPDARFANNGVNLPPYQRVNTATDYDTVGFPHYLRFDGVDDWLITPTITPGTDKVQLFAGVRKLSDPTSGIICELSNNSTTNNGSAALLWNATGVWTVLSKGTTSRVGAEFPEAGPLPRVLTGLCDIPGDSTILRANGTQVASNTTDQGTGDYLTYPLYIGRRGGTAVPFNGHLYGLIVRFGANLPAATIEKTEKYINQKTRAY